MFPQKLIKFEVLVCLVISAQILSTSLSVAAASSSSKSKSKSSKTKPPSSSSHRQRSGHQYAPVLLRPSKPDPHFDILDEQRGINYRSRLREGRDGSGERKPTKLTEATASISTASNINSASINSRKGKKGKTKPLASSSLESTFIRKSISMEEEETTPTRFSGSQLISGDAGPLSPSMRSEFAEKDGWKILMGPSVAPEESDQFADRSLENGRTFTSLTDGAGKHRTITKFKASKRGKSISANANKYYDTNEVSFSKPASKLIGTAKNVSTRKGTPKRTVLVSIPKQVLKHKYATITKRVPSNKSRNQDIAPEKPAKRVRKTSHNNQKLVRPSKLIKSSLEERYASMENEINRRSQAITLDAEKLMLTPLRSSAQPTTLTAASSMSTENLSGDMMEQTERPSSPSYNMESRFDPISLPVRDDTAEVINGNHDAHDNHFQTKTALNSAEYPLISVSASMNYPSNHHKEQGGIITASSFSNQQHPVDESEHHFPALPHTSPSHMAEIHEPALKTAFVEETENVLQHSPPPSPHVEFVGVGSRIPVPPPPFGQLDESRFALHNGRLNSKLPPARNSFPNSFPLELPPQPNFHFQGSLLGQREQSFVTAGRYPHFLVGSSIPSPGVHDNLARPAEPVASSIHPILHHGLHRPIPPHHHRFPVGFPPIPHHHHHPHRHPHHLYRHAPPPIPLGHLRQPISPLDVGNGRKAPPPGEFSIEIGSLVPGHNPPPPPGVDPDHPAVQHALRNPHTILNDGIYIQPTDSTNIQETTKNYLHNLHYQVHKNALIPLDKRLVYLSMIFSWMFWITTFYTYYRWSITGNKAKQIVLNVPKDGDSPLVTTRALDTSSPWNFTKVLEYIEIAQKTYEGFDWQDLECQKRTLCELVQKQNEPWGETGRKLANSYVYRFMDALDGVPVPQMIQNYLRQYKEAISQGKNSSKDCGQVYSQCKFSIKDVLSKAAAKKKA